MKPGQEYWYIRDGDDVAGPFTFAELDERRSRGELGWSQEVSKDRMIWVSASAPTDPLSDESGPTSASFTLAELVPADGVARKGPDAARWVLIGAIALVLVWLVYAVSGSPPGASPGDAEAIMRVLQADDAASKETVNAPGVEKTPSVYSKTIARYIERMREVDTSDCPAEFRVAFEEHIDQWQELAEAIAAMPDGFLDGLVIGALNGYLRGERDGGIVRMTDAVKKASKEVKASFHEVKVIAARYDVALP